ncbi:hypothetical protein KYK30_20600 [Shinella yambaruensis]|uniref:Glycine-rich domain-containing protein n=1 Tax=Shinella yambaruensis TaxID=415996 RepID=A0ABQ5ZKN8_9HYPH|nr:hypothetical protein [Shinella yambaruensis]MCJ8027004.1 hypothetical protein [Shinella yambaruensis]MCU7982104.1 hypothetical protein [Shinella yambaruensis]GLR51279.1 hypothetical protein GCM10007923_24870 [Shinella yambaruensis]
MSTFTGLFGGSSRVKMVYERTITVSEAWTKPSLDPDLLVEGYLVGPGGGGSYNGKAGGGGGAGKYFYCRLRDLAATVAAVIGAGGDPGTGGDQNGKDGGVTSFGKWRVFGGAGGMANGNGGGGAGTHGKGNGSNGGAPGGADVTGDVPYPTLDDGGGRGSYSGLLSTSQSKAGMDAVNGGGGGAGTESGFVGGASEFGGGGGGGGKSTHAGDGGALGMPGQVPGGGGGGNEGANGGAGARGEIRIRIFEGI